MLIALAMVAYGGYYMGNRNTNTALTATLTTPNTPVLTPALTPSVTSTPADDTATLIAAIKKALVAKHGPDAESITVTVSKAEGNYAKGMASATGGGGIWFASRVAGVWKLVWDGNGIIDCSDVAPYPDFPVSMIPECFNGATQKMVTR